MTPRIYGPERTHTGKQTTRIEEVLNMSLGKCHPIHLYISFVFFPLLRKSSFGALCLSQLENQLYEDSFRQVKVPKQTYMLTTIRFGLGVCSPAAYNFMNVTSR